MTCRPYQSGAYASLPARSASSPTVRRRRECVHRVRRLNLTAMRPFAGGPDKVEVRCKGVIGERRAEPFDSPFGVIVPADVRAQTSQCRPSLTPAIVSTVQVASGRSSVVVTIQRRAPSAGSKVETVGASSSARYLRNSAQARTPLLKNPRHSAVQQRRAAAIAEGSSMDRIASPPLSLPMQGAALSCIQAAAALG